MKPLYIHAAFFILVYIRYIIRHRREEFFSEVAEDRHPPVSTLKAIDYTQDSHYYKEYPEENPEKCIKDKTYDRDEPKNEGNDK